MRPVHDPGLRPWFEARFLELLTKSLAISLGLGLLIRQVRPSAFLLGLLALTVCELVTVNGVPSREKLLLVGLIARAAGRRTATTTFLARLPEVGQKSGRQLVVHLVVLLLTLFGCQIALAELEVVTRFRNTFEHLFIEPRQLLTVSTQKELLLVRVGWLTSRRSGGSSRLFLFR